MTFNVMIILRPRKEDSGRGIRVFHKEIGAANEEQAQDFARQMLEGFLAEGVTVETEIMNDYTLTKEEIAEDCQGILDMLNKEQQEKLAISKWNTRVK